MIRQTTRDFKESYEGVLLDYIKTVAPACTGHRGWKEEAISAAKQLVEMWEAETGIVLPTYGPEGFP